MVGKAICLRLVLASAITLALRAALLVQLGPSITERFDFCDTLWDALGFGAFASTLAVLLSCCGRAIWAERLFSCSAFYCAIKVLARVLELPPDALHSTDLQDFSAALAVSGVVSVLEAWNVGRLRARLAVAAAESGADARLLASEGGAAQPEVAPAVASTASQICRLLALAREHYIWVLWGCLALLIRLPFSIAIPHFIAEGIGSAIDYNAAVDDLARMRAEERGTRAIVGILGCGVLDSILDFFNFHLFVVVQQKVIRSLKYRLFHSVMRQEMGFFDVTPCGDLMSRLTADTVEMSENISFVFRFSIEAVVRVTGVAGYMFVNSWQLALLTCTIVPVNAFFNRFYANWLHKNARRSQDALAGSNACASESIIGVATIKAFAKEKLTLWKYGQSVDRYYELGILQGLVQSTYYMVVSTFLMNCVVQAAVVAYGIALCRQKAMLVDSLVGFMLYRGQLQEWVNNILNSYTNLVRGAGAASKVFELLDRVPKLQEPEAAAAVEPGKGAAGDKEGNVSFEEVHFAYASRRTSPILQGVTLDAKAGETLALVGSSGSGKSTLFRLLLHLYEPEPNRGRVLLDGVNVQSMDRAHLCSRVTMVGQEPILFRGSVESNIRYTKAVPPQANGQEGFWRHWWKVWNSIDEDKPVFVGGGCSLRDVAEKESQLEGVMEAAKMANVHNFIMTLAEGYKTEVGEMGKQLSTGQRQRVAIARALMPEPSVLLLDEATSALDNESEKLVQEAMDKASQGRTTLVIAHRLSTVQNATRIAVLEKGRVVEIGTHDALLESDGRYSVLWNRQKETLEE